MCTSSEPRRLEFLRTSVGDYIRQTYPNRELVIIVNDDGAALQAIRAFVESLDRDDIRIVPKPGAFNLGQLRNFSLDHADGDILCQWDDDDRFHPDRIAIQLGELLAQGGRSMFLSEIMLLFEATRTLHYLNWTATPVRVMPATLMCWREGPAFRYIESGPRAQREQDTVLAEDLQRQGGFGSFGGHGHLHIYVAHGANTWPGDFHRMLADELSISKGLLHRREAALRAALAPIDFGPQPVEVMGRNGLAFTLEGRG